MTRNGPHGRQDARVVNAASFDLPIDHLLSLGRVLIRLLLPDGVVALRRGCRRQFLLPCQTGTSSTGRVVLFAGGNQPQAEGHDEKHRGGRGSIATSTR